MRCVLVWLLMLVTLPCFAANWYVSKSAAGTNAGTSWTNAWNEMNQINFGSVACGDTIWVAGGTYAQTMTAVKNCSASGTLTINRVLSTDSVPVAAPGWSSAFDSQVIILNWAGFAGIRLNGINNVVIDGRVGNALTYNGGPVTYGWLLKCTTTSCDGINDGAGNSSYTIQNMEIFGPPCVVSQSCTGNGASGVNLPFGGSNFTYNNVYVHQQGEAFRSANWSGVTIQHSFIGETHNDNIQHEDIIFVSGSITNFTFRWNAVWMSPNDGMFFDGDETNTRMYGNVIYHSGGALITFFTGFTHNVFLYNNVFENDGNFGDFQPAWIYYQGTQTGANENNIYENTFYNGTPAATSDYNGFNTCGDKDSGTHSFCYTSGTQFTNINTTNPLLSTFTLTSAGGTAFATGLALASPFNVDPNGVTRGTPTWTVGAYQYPQAGAASPPANIQGTAVLKGTAKIQ